MHFMDPRTISLCTIAALALILVVFAGCTGTPPAEPAFPTVEKTLAGEMPTPVIVTDADSARAVAEFRVHWVLLHDELLHGVHWRSVRATLFDARVRTIEQQLIPAARRAANVKAALADLIEG